MKHVCIDARMLQSSGVGTVIKTLLPFLSKEKNLSVTVLCFLKDKEELSCFPFRLIIVNCPIYSLKEQWELPWKIPSCDLFWSPHFNIPLLPIRAKKRLVTINDLFHLAHLRTLPWLQKCYAKLFYPAAIRLSDKLTTISHFSLKELHTYFKVNKPIDVIHLAPRPLFTPIFDEKIREDVRHRYQLPHSFILSVGNLKPHKNLSRFLEAYLKLKPQEAVVIAGKRDGLRTVDRSLFELVKKNLYLEKRVHFTGVVSDEDLPAIYSMARLFVFPSLYEGFGLPPLEAMACGCPVLASNAASIPEVCRDGAVYADACDIDAIAFQMENLLHNEKKREQLILKGFNVASCYTPQKTAKAFLKCLYESCSDP